MSLLDTALERIERMMDRKIESASPFRATVASVSGGMATITRLGTSTAETESRAIVAGFDLAVSDEVLCVPVNGKPVVVGRVQRAAGVEQSVPSTFRVGGASGPAVKYGTGSPEGSVTAPVGSVYFRTDGSAGTIIYEKASGSGNTGWLVNASGVNNPVPAMFPLGGEQSADTNAPSTSNTTYASYMGRADAAYTTINLRTEVNTAAATITWAEVGIGTASAITLNGAASITRRGYTDVSASFNSTGEKTVAVTVSGISIGDHLWALFGSEATTPYAVIASDIEYTSSGILQSVAATRISTMASPTAFSSILTTGGPAGFWIGS